MTELLHALGLGPDSVVAVAHAHPDDEVVATSGLLRFLQRAGIETHMVHVTNGEASTVGVHDQLVHGLRRREAAAVSEIVGIPPARRHFLGLPDGTLHHYQNEVRLLTDMTKLVTKIHATHLFLSGFDWYEPVAHPDHRAVRQAGQALGCHLPEAGHQLAVWQHAREGESGVVIPVNASDKLDLLGHHASQFTLHPTETGSATFMGRDIDPDCADRLKPYAPLFENEIYQLYIPPARNGHTRAGRVVLAAAAG